MTATVIDAAEAPDVRRALARMQTAPDSGVVPEPLLIRDGNRLFALVEVTRTSWPVDEEMARLSTSAHFHRLIEHARQQAEEIPADAVADLLGFSESERASIRRRTSGARRPRR